MIQSFQLSNEKQVKRKITSIRNFDTIEITISSFHIDRDKRESDPEMRSRSQRPGAEQIILVTCRETRTGNHGEVIFRYKVVTSTTG